MKKRMLLMSVFLTATVVLVLGSAAPQGQRETVPLEDAKLIIEFNASDEDVGVQAFFDGGPWKTMRIISPDKRRIFEVEGKGTLRRLGLTELFFESEEPELADLPLEDFLELFPEGEYRFVGRTVEGDELVGTATFTHNIPNGPLILSPQEGEEVDPTDVTISWQEVTSPPGIQIAGYQVIVEQDDAINVLDIKVPAGVTSLTVPPQFLQAATEYDFEILAIEVGGNQTITQSSFSTE